MHEEEGMVYSPYQSLIVGTTVEDDCEQAHPKRLI
jgi:hypothetical protein